MPSRKVGARPLNIFGEWLWIVMFWQLSHTACRTEYLLCADVVVNGATETHSLVCRC